MLLEEYGALYESNTESAANWLYYSKKEKTAQNARFQAILELVPTAGVEPAWYCYHRILSPARLPVPPRRHVFETT